MSAAPGPAWLRRDAERIAGALPPLLAEAEQLAAAALPGAHGRRRAGAGETFWQYRAAQPGDPLPSIDWRRSARSDSLFVREMEWEAAQTVWIWPDRAQSMDYRSDAAPRSKAERAALLSLALSVLLIRAGERVALLAGDAARPATGETQLLRAANALAAPPYPDRRDYGAPPPTRWRKGGVVLFISDFLGPLDPLKAALGAAADAGARGALMQLLDPAEIGFPFDGRLVFESMRRETRFETQRAGALAQDYRDRLAARRDTLETLAAAAGWRLLSHDTGESPRAGLLALCNAIGGGR